MGENILGKSLECLTAVLFCFTLLIMLLSCMVVLGLGAASWRISQGCQRLARRLRTSIAPRMALAKVPSKLKAVLSQRIGV